MTPSPFDEADAAQAGPGSPRTSDTALFDWGFGDITWPWTTRLDILFVIDGRITVGHGSEEFGLGQVLDTLRSSFAWWVRVKVRVVNRDEPESFRFDQQGFDIDAHDQIWFFGDWPGEEANDPSIGDEIIDDSQYSPLSDAELRIVAEWMDRGGGVFATGDHALLGASMCHRIPRVRTMRKWTRAMGVPSFADDDRHETLQHFAAGNYGSWEGDRWAQQIYPVYRTDTNRPFFFGQHPHPLLCGRNGIISRFPDHMHEGAVVDTDEVALDVPLGIPGYSKAEYPAVSIVVEPNGVALARIHGIWERRPRPEVIAYGLTTNRESAPVRFPLIGVYDGDDVGLGRVVVDSTWHHWFSMNLVGFKAEVPSLYQGMQSYFRNVALWLATPSQRASMLLFATWGVVAGKQPGLFSRFMDIWEVGERVVDVIGRAAPHCILTDMVATQLPSHPAGAQFARSPLRPSDEELNTLMLGGIGLTLIELAQQMFKDRAHGRDTTPEPETILELGLKGVQRGLGELSDFLESGASDLAAMSEALKSTYRTEVEPDRSAKEQAPESE